MTGIISTRLSGIIILRVTMLASSKPSTRISRRIFPWLIQEINSTHLSTASINDIAKLATNMSRTSEEFADDSISWFPLSLLWYKKDMKQNMRPITPKTKTILFLKVESVVMVKI